MKIRHLSLHVLWEVEHPVTKRMLKSTERNTSSSRFTQRKRLAPVVLELHGGTEVLLSLADQKLEP